MMGNKSSSSVSSASSSAVSRRNQGQQGIHHPSSFSQLQPPQNRVLSKSASSGSSFGASGASGTSSSEEDSSSHSKYSNPQEKVPLPTDSTLQQPPLQLFHYNIHCPKDLLDFDLNHPHHHNHHIQDPPLHPSKRKVSLTGNTANNYSLVAKRHSSALEFISGKSPLRDYLKDKFSRGGGNGGNNTGKGGGEQNTTTTATLGASAPPTSSSSSSSSSSTVDKYAKLLAQLSLNETPKSGLISENGVRKHVLPHSPVLVEYLWKFLKKCSQKEGLDPKIDAISEGALVATTEKIFLLHTDKDQLTFYLKMFACERDMVEIESFMDFLISSYQLATVGESQEHALAFRWKSYNNFQGKEALEAVVKSCYHIKEEMSVCFLVNWLLPNLPRLHHLLHKYLLHQLTTGHAQLVTGNATIHTQMGGVTFTNPNQNQNLLQPIPLFLPPTQEEEAQEGEEDKSKEDHAANANVRGDNNDTPTTKPKFDPVLLWLLKSSLPPKFLAIFNKKPEVSAHPHSPHLNSAQRLLQLIHLKQDPPNWDLLYDSENDGLSINRFQFHVFNYRGPTLLVVTADNGYAFAIAADTEWKESCHFWGNEEATLFQLQPEFRIVEKGNKLIYVNFSIRGYPFGLQAGKDPRNVSLDIKPDFSYAHYKKIPCRVLNLSVWGCAPQQAATAQTEYKQWEAKQCENLRKVNINSAEWKDNPDKYLLELAGNYRSYNDH